MYLLSVSSGLLGSVGQSAVYQRGVSSEADGLACEPHGLPSVAGLHQGGVDGVGGVDV